MCTTTTISTNQQARGPIASQISFLDEIVFNARNFCSDATDFCAIELRYITVQTVKRQACHMGDVEMIGMVYLMPEKICQGGVFFKHLSTGDFSEIREADSMIFKKGRLGIGAYSRYEV